MFDPKAQETPEAPKGEQQSPQSSASTSPFDTMLSEIRNDRGEPKYRSVEDGLTALKHSQAHILSLTSDRQKLEAELVTLRAKTDSIDELKATVEKLTQRSSEPQQKETQLNEEALANLVDSRLSFQQAQAAKLDNQKSVAGKLQEVYGDKARDLFYEKASQLGFSADEFEALSAKSPKAILTMFNINGDGALKQPNKSPPVGKVNSEGFQRNPSSFIGSESEKIPLGGGDREYKRILENSRSMVEELGNSGMSVHDLTDPVNYQKYFRK